MNNKQLNVLSASLDEEKCNFVSKGFKNGTFLK